jgi:D-beta-D-heptose 7-phosphate kinase/D-beta-D-heptose 1-phosphate adenosyltransferase
MGIIVTLPQAVALRQETRTAKRTLVFTNGHFDLLHVGHLDYLEKARGLGDVLFVGVNGDNTSQALKGAGRPIVPASERARLVAALCCVDVVMIFDELTASAVIDALRPEIYVKGGDYRDKTLPERAAVESYGGRVELIDLLPGHSTSALIGRIQALPEV